jgi:hypothetical protein
MKEKYNLKPVSDWGKKCYIQRLKDINETFNIFYKLVYTDFTLYELMMDERFKKLISSFETYNGISLDGNAMDVDICDLEIYSLECKAKLYNWLINEYHPRVLFEEFVLSIKAFNFEKRVKSLDVFGQIKQFISHSLRLKEMFNFKGFENITDPHEFNQEEMLLRFYDFIDKFKTQLKV